MLYFGIMMIIYFCKRSLSENVGNLVLDYYKERCPMVEEIVQRQVQIAVLKDPRMAASLLRLHFHDCFVMVNLLSLSFTYHGNGISLIIFPLVFLCVL